jgi:4-amino-4-deoxy-L-arabinose transferase-like glycosyltransferase
MAVTAPEKTSVMVETRAAGRAHVVALWLIIALAVVLYGWNIGAGGYGDPFYATTVKSMSHSMTNFVFGSFDPLGLDTVDKPPMAFWPQVVSVKIFGFHGWALLLPQVIEGAATVFLLHRVVRRWMGESVALLAALIMALTPITVAVNRDNSADTLLTLWCVAAVYAVTRAIQESVTPRKATWWVVLAAFLLGCGFVTKFMAAWMLVPTLAVGYLVGRQAGWGRRVADLIASGGVLVVSSLWWVALTTWWQGRKPYIGSTVHNSTWDLAFGYNGFSRVLGEQATTSGGHGAYPGGPPSADALKVISLGKAIGAAFAGDPVGSGRLFGGTVGPQFGWLVPWCALSLIAAAVVGVLTWRRRRSLNRLTSAGWVLWGSWLVVVAGIFSYEQGVFHAYYTAQLAPPVAAVSAAGLVLLWRLRRRPGPAWLLLPLGVVITAAWAWVLVADDVSYNGWLRYAVAVLAVITLAGLAVDRFRPSVPRGLTYGLVACGVATALLSPAVWAVDTAFRPVSDGITNGYIPSAGPVEASFGGGSTLPPPLKTFLLTGQLPGGSLINTDKLAPKQQKILRYVTAHAGSAKVPLAVEGGALRSAQYSLSTDLTVIGLGGFKGEDPAPSVGQLAALQRQHQLAFVLSVPVASGAAPGGFGSSLGALQRRRWVQSNCTVVPPTAYGESGAPLTPSAALAAQLGLGEQTLYACSR